MKYKVGDKVRVRQWDDMVEEFGLYDRKDIGIPSCFFVKEMRKYCGSVVTIRELTCRDTRYLIEEDDCCFFWTDDMFENMYYSCADNIAKSLQNAYDKVFESILPKPILFPPKYPKHNDMLDTFTKIPKGEIKITAEETREMMNGNTTVEAKKEAHPKDEDHLKRVEKIQKRIDYYKRKSGFEEIEEVVPEKVLKVTFNGRTCKLVCDSRDVFSLEKALYIAIAKRYWTDTCTSEGIEKKAEEIKLEKCYVNKVEKAKKLLAAMKDLEKENAEYEALLEARRQKRWERKQKQMDRRAEKKRIQEEKEREEKIQILTEAILRAMKTAKEEEKKEENISEDKESVKAETKPEENMTETTKENVEESTEDTEETVTTTE